MNKLKALALACALSLPAVAGAMTEAEYAEAQALTQAMDTLFGEAAFGEPADDNPDIAVSEVVTTRREYPAGGRIEGTFTATNPSGFPAEGTFKTIIIGDFDADGNYRTAYGVELDGEPFSLAAGASRQVSFSAPIPDGLNGSGFKVRVQARLAGSLLRGWADSEPLTFVGDGSYATVRYAYLIGPDGAERSPGSGPFLDGDFPYVDLKVGFRGGAAALSLTPTVRLVNRGTGETETARGVAVSVPANGEAEGSVRIDRGDLAPGVYEGEVSWSAADGKERASSVPVRVVVSGEAATVHAVRVSSERVAAGEPFTVSLDVSGSPQNHEATPEENRAAIDWRAAVTVTVRSGTIAVAEGTWRGELPADGTIEVPLEAEVDAAALTADVSVRGSDGRVLFAREYPLLAATGTPRPEVPAENPIDRAFWVSVAGAAALLAILILLIARRHRVAAATVIAITLVVVASRSAAPATAAGADGGNECPFGANEWSIILTRQSENETWTSLYNLYRSPCASGGLSTNTNLLEDDGTLSDSVPLGIYINTPAANTTYYCGQDVNVTGTSVFVGCTNTGIYGRTRVWITRFEPDGSEVPVTPVREYARDVGASGDHDHFTIDIPFSVQTDMTTRDGNYRVRVHSYTVGGVGAALGGHAYRDFKVKNCDLCKNIAGDQTTVPGGMSRDAAGLCQCPTASTFNTASGQCEDEDGVCVTCGLEGSCPSGTKYCDGVCIPNSATCGGAAVTQCPIEPDSQYCAEIYDRTGARTDQFSGYTAEELEAIFGFGVREALEKQAAAGTKDSVWGVVGRATSLQGGLDARHGSSGCAGVLCTYGIDGCLATSDVDSGDMAANCSPINDPVPGGLEPRALLVVEPTVINQGESCRVSWSSHEMRTCSISGSGISSTALAGSKMTPALQQTASYRLTCVDATGKTHEQVESCNVDPDVAEF